MFNGGGFNNLGFNTGSAEGNVIDLSAHLSGSGQMYSRKIEMEADASSNAFNNMPFNTVNQGSNTEYSLDFNMYMALSANLSGEGRIQGAFVRGYVLQVERMSCEGRLSAENIRGIVLEPRRMSGEGRMFAEASKYHTDWIEFTDAFRPGDVIIIDSGKFKITRNGVNVSHLYNGDFFDLNLGENRLTWTDPATGRTILFRITHRDKFLY
ncbi:hypothetical protein NYE69_27005 [Paenibacillus sp. FSL R5-0527]|uniref:phage distal tail protein n=1 Tax=Paenibacillus sp. FSL R5-0527 TaxID=2975321 RepID=UPI00097AFD9E|nr:hypothetical protein BK140_22480 [Paenibacillus macerans]